MFIRTLIVATCFFSSFSFAEINTSFASVQKNPEFSPELASPVALQKLDNVINNNIPLQYRDTLSAKTDVVRTNIYELLSAIKKLQNVINYNTPAEYREQLNRKVNQVKEAISSDLGLQMPPNEPQPPRPSGYYCATACKRFDGQPDLTAARGALGLTKIEARQASIELLKKDYTCNYGTVEVDCEQPATSTYVCQFACKSFDGRADLSTSVVGQPASTSLEAQMNASKSLRDRWTCNYGAMKVACETR